MISSTVSTFVLLVKTLAIMRVDSVMRTDAHVHTSLRRPVIRYRQKTLADHVAPS